MKSYKQWKNKRLLEQVVPLLNLEFEPIGNEAGEHILASPFAQAIEGFKKRITELPHPQNTGDKGLGELGMDQVSKDSFPTIAAGQTPTLSQGIPVG